jgi:hypothetical protein
VRLLGLAPLAVVLALLVFGGRRVLRWFPLALVLVGAGIRGLAAVLALARALAVALPLTWLLLLGARRLGATECGAEQGAQQRAPPTGTAKQSGEVVEASGIHEGSSGGGISLRCGEGAGRQAPGPRGRGVTHLMPGWDRCQANPHPTRITVSNRILLVEKRRAGGHVEPKARLDTES